MRLDELDVGIVTLLQRDARLSFRDIAEKLGSTTPTVSARVKALEDIGILQGYHAKLDHAILGGRSYVVTLTTQPAKADDALAALRDMHGVTAVHLLPGGRLVAHAHLRPPTFALPHLHAALAAIPGLVTYDASEVIRGHEGLRDEDLPQNVDVPCHQCKGPIHGEPIKGKFGERVHVFCCRQCLADFRGRYEELQKAARANKPPPRRAPPAPHHHP